MPPEQPQDLPQDQTGIEMTPDEAKASLGLATRLSEQLLMPQMEMEEPEEEETPEEEPKEELDVEKLKEDIKKDIIQELKKLLDEDEEEED